MDAQYAGEFGPDAMAIRHALQFPPEVVRRETTSGRWKDETVTTYLRRWAREAPDAIAAEAPGYPPLTFAQALDKSERFAAALSARGMRRGDVLMVQLPSGPDFLIAYYAAARLGAVLSTLHMPYGPVEAEPLLRECLAIRLKQRQPGVLQT